ncbi:hypothetical protein VKT23_006772 [Stygiomarasmius scandens]|uniref:glucan endo-1,3-beta-D-glucosidase n=1 Tax=Marasmiellus scandens TaxID=2682957 RepID=A0ABR1JQI7_9AGAR
MYSQYRDQPGHDSNYDLQDYYDAVPPAHRLSGFHNSTDNIPLSTQPSSRPGSGYGQLNNGSTADFNSPFRDSAAVGAGAGAAGLGAAAAAGYARRPHFGDRRQEMANEPLSDRDAWLEKNHQSGKRSRWIVIGVIALAIIIVIGVVVGVVVSKKNSSSSSSSASVVQQTDQNDPSTFVKDSRLKQSFYGIAYTPEGAQLPECGANLKDVITDIQLLSQLTTRIRLYGADCNQSALVLEAIKETKVDMQVFLGNYPAATDGGEAYARQRDIIKQAIQDYGTDHIAGVTVGNEFILNYLNANGGGSDPNSAVGNQGGEALITNITDTRSMLTDLGVTLKVGNADAGSYFNDEVLAKVDYGMANVHPWFANVSIDQAAGWTWDFFETQDVSLAQGLSNNPQMSIAETGWPTASSDAGNESNGPSTASEENLQKFLDTFVCQANTNGTEYFFFEFFDEPWKDKQFGGVEGWWGLFYSNRTLKNIEIPDCSGSSSTSTTA